MSKVSAALQKSNFQEDKIAKTEPNAKSRAEKPSTRCHLVSKQSKNPVEIPDVRKSQQGFTSNLDALEDLDSKNSKLDL